MTKLLCGLHRLLLGICTLLVVAIIGALSVQIVSRYVFNAPVHMTDDIAEISLVWLTFLGAAAVYREGGHIGVDVLGGLKNPVVQRVLHIVPHLLVICVLAYVLWQVRRLYPLMSRLDFGTVPKGPLTSKFVLILLPFGLGAAMTIVFAIEAIWKASRGTRRTTGVTTE